MTESEAAAQIKSELLRHARIRTMLMDCSKVGLHNFVRFATLSDLDRIVVNRDPEGAIQKAVSKLENGPQLVVA